MLLPLLMSHLTSPHRCGSELILLGVKAFSSGTSLQDICDAAGWSTPPQSYQPSLLPYTLGRDLSVWWRGYIVPKSISDAARSSRKGTSQVTYVTSQVTYVTMFPRVGTRDCVP